MHFEVRPVPRGNASIGMHLRLAMFGARIVSLSLARRRLRSPGLLKEIAARRPFLL